MQGAYDSSNFAEELFSNETVDKSIRVSDRAAVVNLMIGLQAYTISSGIYAKYLHGDRIISVPLKGKETMHIGYIINKDRTLSELGERFIGLIGRYQEA